MLTIPSQQFSTSSKADLLLNKLSPSFRNKRIPSAQDNYSCSSNQNLKISKTESPSKFSQEIKRRKSQLLEGNISHNRRKEKANSTQNIIDSVNYLKEEYRSLKDAYKELIQQKIKNTNQIDRIKEENSKLKEQVDAKSKQNQKLKTLTSFMEQQNLRMKKEYIRLLEVERFKAKKLQESLSQKEELISSVLKNNKNQNENSFDVTEVNFFKPQVKHKNNQDDNQIIVEESLTISQDRQQDRQKSMTNPSQILSFSLTSMMEESVFKQQTNTRRKKQHYKVLSELANNQIEEIKVSDLKSGKNKDQNVQFKKFRKEISHKLEINIDGKQSKPYGLGHNGINAVGPKTPVSFDKKLMKNKNSKSKRKDDDKENMDVKNSKKKAKRAVNVSQNQ